MSKDFWIGGILAVVIISLAVFLNLNYNHNDDLSANISTSIDIDNGDSKIEWEHYSSYDIELNDTYNIVSSGTYHFTGTLNEGSIIVKVSAESVVKIILDNVTIKNSTGPAIACYGGDDLVIELKGENYIEDGDEYDARWDEDVKGAIYSKSDLTFQGTGSMTLLANYEDGIVGKDDLKFNGGTYKITASDDAIRGKDSVYIKDGDFTIESKGDGIKSTNETNITKGFVLLESGDIRISSGDDGIHAYRTLIIDGGEVQIEKSYEGLEAQKISINNGEITIAANDDGINASGGTTTNANRQNPFNADENCVLLINGGELYVNAAGDGLDSNGWIYINGGKVIVDGPTNNGNGALDFGAGIVMNGGFVVAIGASGMAENLGNTSSVNNVSIYFSSTLPKETAVEIKNSAGETIISHTSAKPFSHMAAGTTNFENGETYTIYVNGEVYESFEISDVLTVIGSGGNNFQMGGPGQRGRK